MVAGAAPVRAAVERELGSEVVSARNHAGGFSPGTAARVELADGRVVFVKAVSSALNDVAVELHRAEADVLARLPPEMPVPRLQARIDAEVDGVDWVALVIDHADGTMPHRPWRPDELARVLAAIDLAARAGTPSPVPDMRSAATHHLGGLARLDERSVEELLDPWSRDHLAELSLSRPAGATRSSATPSCSSTHGPTTCCSATTTCGSSTGRTPSSARRGST